MRDQIKKRGNIMNISSWVSGWIYASEANIVKNVKSEVEKVERTWAGFTWTCGEVAGDIALRVGTVALVTFAVMLGAAYGKEELKGSHRALACLFYRVEEMAVFAGIAAAGAQCKPLIDPVINPVVDPVVGGVKAYIVTPALSLGSAIANACTSLFFSTKKA